MNIRPQKIQKITAHIPKELLHNAQIVTHKGITETIKIGLVKVAAEKAYKNLLNLGGKVKIDLDLKELRKDRNL